jgi:ligand-binding sensor domain-containing protein
VVLVSRYGTNQHGGENIDTTHIVATGHGIVTYERHEHAWHPRAHSLDGQNVTSAIAREGVILAGTTNGVFRSDDYGETWQPGSSGLHTRHVRWMAFHPDLSDYEFVGTEPAAIFVSHNGAVSWRECPEVAQLRDEHGWMLPYSPEAGCVRGFTFHDTRRACAGYLEYPFQNRESIGAFVISFLQQL